MKEKTKKMKRKYFKNINELAKKMYEIVKVTDSVTAVLFFDKASENTKKLLQNPNINIGVIELESAHEYGAYDKEFYVTLTYVDGVELYVEKALNECGKYLFSGSGVVYLDGDVNSKIVDSFEDGTKKYEIVDKADLSDDKFDKCKGVDKHKKLVFKRKEKPVLKVEITPIKRYNHTFTDDCYLDDLLFW